MATYLLTNSVVNRLDPPTDSLAGDVLFHDVGTIARAPSNADGGAEKGAEGDAAAADANCACPLGGALSELGVTEDESMERETI